MIEIYKGWWHRDADKMEDYIFDKGISVPIVKVRSIHALNALVGYCKYIYGNEGLIFFRGQKNNYQTLKPGLYRNVISQATMSSHKGYLNKFIDNTIKSNQILNNMDKVLVPPLLQHYGIKTDWIDLVDNLWVALWFSVHDYISAQYDKQYEFIKAINRDTKSTYLYLVLSDASDKNPKIPGYFTGKNSHLVDLRVAAPSVFLRPHTQHALLMKKKSMSLPVESDMSECVKLIIELEPTKVFEWLGNGRLLSAENIYPSPVYDQGYSILLKGCPKPNFKYIGSISLITNEAYV